MRISDWSSDVCSSDLLARIGVDPGHVIQIVMLTIAMRQPGKYTQYAQVALQAYPFVSAMKVDEIGGNRQPGRLGGFPLAYGTIQLLSLFPRGARIHTQRGDVVADRPDQVNLLFHDARTATMEKLGSEAGAGR